MKVKSDYLIYCDESCPLEHEPITLLGAVGCSYENKDKIVQDLRELKNKYFINSKYETKWVKLSKAKVNYYKELIDYFHNNMDIRIRILIAKDKEYLNNNKYNEGDYQNWYYKMYYYLLDRLIDTNSKYYMLYDEKDKYTTFKMNNVKNIIKSKKSFDNPEYFDLKIKQINSKESELMQLLDVIMGAVGYKNRGFYNNNSNQGEAKKEIVDYLEKCFDQDLTKKTSPFEYKFNIFIWTPRKEAN